MDFYTQHAYLQYFLRKKNHYIYFCSFHWSSVSVKTFFRQSTFDVPEIVFSASLKCTHAIKIYSANMFKFCFLF